jgi:hypothetical protein
MTRPIFPTLLVLFAGVTLLGCNSLEPPAPPPDLAKRIVPPPPVAQPAAVPERPRFAEVEINGTIVRPKGLKGDITVWATNGPCFAPQTKAYGSTKTNPDRWFVEVFVPQGSDVWLCGASSDGKYSGQSTASPVRCEGVGEITPHEQVIPLKKGAKVTPPESMTH